VVEDRAIALRSVRELGRKAGSRGLRRLAPQPDDLGADELRGLPLIVGGRSLGARVACRTAAATGAAGVLCLAFPLQPPRRSGSAPSQSRLAELDAVSVPTLVVQGERDPFGMPPSGPSRTVVRVPGDHSLRTDVEAVAAAARAWLPRIVAQAAGVAYEQ